MIYSYTQLQQLMLTEHLAIEIKYSYVASYFS